MVSGKRMNACLGFTLIADETRGGKDELYGFILVAVACNVYAGRQKRAKKKDK